MSNPTANNSIYYEMNTSSIRTLLVYSSRLKENNIAAKTIMKWLTQPFIKKCVLSVKNAQLVDNIFVYLTVKRENWTIQIT